MTPALQLRAPAERAYDRAVFLALELLDAVTLARVGAGLTVTAQGLDGRPVRNASGFFVWLAEPDAAARIERITIDPGRLPYLPLTVAATDLAFPFTSRELAPRVDYPFGSGDTALRGSLTEDRATPPLPVTDADVGLEWLDENDTWQSAPTIVGTDDRGDFAALLRLAPSDNPKHDANGALTVRVRARRSALSQRRSDEFSMMQGRVADPQAFAWNEMHP